MLVLFETAAGFALFKVRDGTAKAIEKDEKRGKELNDPAKGIYAKHFGSASAASEALELQAFERFRSTAEALDAATGLLEGRIPDALNTFLKQNISKNKALKDEKLIVGESKLRSSIAHGLGLKCFANEALGQEVLRGVRAQMATLLPEVTSEDMSAMALGLSHSLSRYKLKFSPDKVDTMIVQAVSLLDDLDKELNTYAMRVREWYGWHFPEMGKIIADNILFAKVARKMGDRTNCPTTDLSEFLPEELEAELKDAEKISMGTEITERDIESIRGLATQVIEISAYREQLFEYLQQRMRAIAPNLTILVGELVGARLIAQAGSLMTLAKYPASTVQILGAEKALFRALKAKHETPKYGLIFHASLVGQAAPKDKGKISRVLAAKASLATRFDALCEDTGVTPETEVGEEGRSKVEQRLRSLEGGQIRRVSGQGKKVAHDQRQKQESQQMQQMKSSKSADAAGKYNESSDVVAPKKRKRDEEAAPVVAASDESDDEPKQKRQKKEKKGKKDKKDNKKDKKKSKKDKKKK